MKKLLATAVILTAAILASDYAYSNKTNMDAKYCNAQTAISEAEVKQAQTKWAKSIIEIGMANNPKQKAIETIDNLYGFDVDKVLFKPTLASADQFRTDKKEALSYFVGGDNPEDAGFALRGFTNIKFNNEAIITNCDMAMAMGNYFFTTKEGEKMKVEYSFGYKKLPNQAVKIVLHHSSLPYKPLYSVSK
jgi:hypothetical protein